MMPRCAAGFSFADVSFYLRLYLTRGKKRVGAVVRVAASLFLLFA